MKFQEAWNKLRESEDFVKVIAKSTRASWGGSGYSVELFEDGRYRILWNNQIGNRYQSDGIIIGIPALNPSDFEGFEDDEPLENVVQWYENEIAEEMLDGLRERLEYEQREQRYA